MSWKRVGSSVRLQAQPCAPIQLWPKNPTLECVELAHPPHSSGPRGAAPWDVFWGIGALGRAEYLNTVYASSTC